MAAMALSGLPVSSCLMTWRSSPFFFRSSMASSRPLVMVSPMGACGPVMELMKPTLMGAARRGAGEGEREGAGQGEHAGPHRHEASREGRVCKCAWCRGNPAIVEIRNGPTDGPPPGRAPGGAPGRRGQPYGSSAGCPVAARMAVRNSRPTRSAMARWSGRSASASAGPLRRGRHHHLGEPGGPLGRQVGLVGLPRQPVLRTRSPRRGPAPAPAAGRRAGRARSAGWR